MHITDTESFEYTFGKKALRKKPKIFAMDFEVYFFYCAEGCGSMIKKEPNVWSEQVDDNYSYETRKF